MDVSIFGTCRLDALNRNNQLNNLVNYTHTTKEVIQLLKFFREEIVIESPYDVLCFRTGILNNSPIILTSQLLNIFNNTKLFVVEICSRKKYIHNNYYLHHLSVDRRHGDYYLNTPSHIINEHRILLQSEDEICEDLDIIKKLINNKQLLVVTHYNSKLKGEYLNNRNELINIVKKSCERLKIKCVDPTEILCYYNQEQVMSSDLGHYTQFGIETVASYFNEYIKKLLTK